MKPDSQRRAGFTNSGLVPGSSLDQWGAGFSPRGASAPQANNANSDVAARSGTVSRHDNQASAVRRLTETRGAGTPWIDCANEQLRVGKATRELRERFAQRGLAPIVREGAR
jgi:hypothetical protein